MMSQYRYLLKITIALLIVSTLAVGNVRTGKTQSEMDWTSPINLSVSGVATDPQMFVDSRGAFHVIWVDGAGDTNSPNGFRYSWSADNINWTFPSPVLFPFSVKDSPPVFLAEPDGSVHVFWMNTKAQLNYAQTTAENFGNPSKWTVINGLSQKVSTFDVVSDPDGILHLVYVETVTDESGFAGVYYRQLVDGASWSEAARIYQSEYFRSTTSSSANVRVMVSNQPEKKRVYVAWDNRSQKRIFTAISDDIGKTWSAPQQIMGPAEVGNQESPFNVSVWAGGENVLLMWQMGKPGASKCSVYSQWSSDEGKTWGDATALFGGPTACPTGIKFPISQDDGKVAALLNNDPGDSILIAWNGSQWSEPQSQTRLPALSNPETYDPIFLNCQQDIIYQNKLYVVGCDQAGGGDVWLLSRTLVPLDNWFLPTTLWSDPDTVTDGGPKISNLASVSDAEGNLHLVWVETPLTQDSSKPFIQYSRWDGSEWSSPATIIRKLSGEPLQLAMNLDSQNRLMLVWVDGGSGDLLFSWANLKQAGLSSGWEESVALPSPSHLNSSPDILVDSTGRIVVTYAVPFNEHRGIYTVQSTDGGFTWSPYMLAFDGVASKWEVVDYPRIALSGDGVLHLIFTRQVVWTDQLLGLYYSQSKDGGLSWSDPQLVSESNIYWSEIVAYGENTVHRLWQEDNGLVVANLSQVSQDGGLDWDKSLEVTGVSEDATQVILATNGLGNLCFVQLIKDKSTEIANRDRLIVQGWKWDGSRWDPDSPGEFAVRGIETRYAVTAGITSKGYLNVALATEYIDSKGENRNKIISLSRFLKDSNTPGNTFLSAIPTPSFLSNESPALPTQTPVVDLAILYQSNDPSEGLTKDLVGIALIGAVVVVTVLLLIRRNPRRKGRAENAD